MPAAGTIGLFGVLLDQPVAGLPLGIGAEAVGAITRPERVPRLTCRPFHRLECRQARLGGQIAQPVRATLAHVVLEIEDLAALLASEELHAELAFSPFEGTIRTRRTARSLRQGQRPLP